MDDTMQQAIRTIVAEEVAAMLGTEDNGFQVAGRRRRRRFFTSDFISTGFFTDGSRSDFTFGTDFFGRFGTTGLGRLFRTDFFRRFGTTDRGHFFNTDIFRRFGTTEFGGLFTTDFFRRARRFRRFRS